MNGIVKESGTAHTGTAPQSRYVSEIDGLRCFAMTAVVLQHCELLPFGWTGVWLFYVISGFAITTSLLNQKAENQKASTALGHFFMRRAIRIWPIYVLFILANVIFLFAIGNHLPFADLPYLLTFTHNFRMMLVDYDATGGGWPAFGHLWTISVEEQFYLVFPFLFLFLVRSRLHLALWAFVAAGPLIRFWFSGVAESMGRGDEHAAFAVYVFSPGHFDAFAMGALLALNRDRITASPVLAWRLFGIALAAGAVYVGYYGWLNIKELGFGVDSARNILSGVMFGEGRQVFIYSIVAAFAAAMIALILAGVGFAKAIAGQAPFQWVGRISYGAYLYHLPMVVIAGTLFPDPRPDQFDFWRQAAVFATAYAATLVLASASFRYLEQPILRLRSRFA